MVVKLYGDYCIEYDPGDDVEGWFSVSFYDPDTISVSVGSPDPLYPDAERGDIKVPLDEFIEFFEALEKRLFGAAGRKAIRAKPLIHEDGHYAIPHRCPEDCPSGFIT